VGGAALCVNDGDGTEKSQCVDSEGQTVAYYSLKLPGEPEYISSGCSLTIVNQQHDFLALGVSIS
jgi:hypothetical protein